MANPLLMRVTRGSVVESIHRGSVAAWRGGRIVLASGDTASPVFLRSAAKPFQAMVFVVSGAADAVGATREELAVACASHGAEDVHLAAVRSLLAKGGLDPSTLGCGAHPPACTAASVALARSGGRPEVLHNNCSGKHAAMVLTAKHLGAPVDGYLDPDHPVQVANRRHLALFAGMPPEEVVLATDGCSAPNFAVSLERQAAAFGRLASPDATIPPAEAAAARRIVEAMTSHPRLIAWRDAGDAALMGAAPGRVVSKLGAEGVQGIGIPASGLGLAFKVDDGAGRPRLPVAIALLRAAGVFGDAEAAAVGEAGDTVLRNHRGREVGRLEVVLPEGTGALAGGGE